MTTLPGSRVHVAARILHDIRGALTGGPNSGREIGDIRVSLSLPDALELLAGYLNDESVSIGPTEASPAPVSKPAETRVELPAMPDKRPTFDARLGARFAGTTDAGV